MDATSPQPQPAPETRKIWVWLIVAGLAITSSTAIAFYFTRQPDSATLLRDAQTEFIKGNYAAAERYAAIVVRRDSNHTAALLAGNAAVKLIRPSLALEYFNRIPDDSAEAVAARCRAGDLLLLELKQLATAEEQFQRAYHLDSNSVTASDRLSYLFGLSARNWDAIDHRLHLIRLDQFTSIHLFLLGMGDLALQNQGELDEYAAASPKDPLVLLGIARNAIDRQQFEEAEQLLRRVVAIDPTLIEAEVKLGQVLLQNASDERFLQWHSALLKSADQHPEIWSIRGMYSLRTGDTPTAIRCFWEAVRIDPNHRRANYQLAQSLQQLGENQQAQPFFDRADLLQEYFNTVKTAYLETDLASMRKAAELSESLGLLWEAFGWNRLVQRRAPHIQWAQQSISRLRARLSHLEIERTIRSANPAISNDLSNYPVPNWGPTINGTTDTKPRSLTRSNVRFSDRASSAGLHFQYDNGSNPDMPGHRMFEFTGGGVAILDYDNDGWPDIYLTQGCDWPPKPEQQTHLDRLYRNQGDGTFADVTHSSRIVENGFSQGVTVGDFNNDGFPDFYVANIGSNRFFENNGDGTFTDITSVTATAGNSWSTSCLIADFNLDTTPDLYIVNYLSGNDVFERICPDGEGVMRACPPRNFPAAQDQVYTNLTDGRFDNSTNQSGVQANNGRGLGIVAGDFDGDGRLNLFIANDAVPNFYFVNSTDPKNNTIRYSEQGLARGLALNEDGGPEGCMGVAAGDVDQDGLLDLCVTNFYNESNTLFLQTSNQLFTDGTRRFGLQEPTLKQLGFGTQFLDGNLDGKLDLIVANGDVDDNRDIGRAYRMPPQYFENTGKNRFIESPPQQLGPYFQARYLGRSLARVDWNRDGLDDVVISHLDAPAALLTNSTAKSGNFVAFRLVGVHSSRDAIGSTLTATIGKEKLMRQLTAGDGYQASNERRIVFGLGVHQQVDEFHIRWPSGTIQQFDNLAAGTEFLLIEGRPPLKLP